MQLTTLKTAVAAVLTLLTVSTAQAVASPRVTQFPIRADFTSLTDIVPGPDGALYVPDRGLGRVTARSGSPRSPVTRSAA